MKPLGKLGLSALLVALATSPAYATTSTATQTFSISANVSTYASLSFAGKTDNSFNYLFQNGTSGVVTDNGMQFLAASNNGSAVINASLRTTATSGVGQIYFTAPANLVGSGGASVPTNGVLSYTCTGSYNEYNPSTGTSSSTNLPTPTGNPTAVGTGNNNCVTLSTGGHSIQNSTINLNLFLDDRTIPADNYTAAGNNGFTITVSAT